MEEKYLERQMLGWRFICPIGPSNQRIIFYWLIFLLTEGQNNFGNKIPCFSILGAHYVIDTINDLPGVVEKINERLAMGLGPACWITKQKGEKQIDDLFLSFTFCLLNLIALKLLTLWKLYFSASNKYFGQKTTLNSLM